MSMACFIVVNMRKGVLLHKLILLKAYQDRNVETYFLITLICLLLAIMQRTFRFMSFGGYGWYLASTAALLYCSWFVHNIVAWIKIKPFFIEI